MSTLSKDLVLLTLQFFDEEGFKESARMLERECGYFFNMKFFEDMILSGDWVGAEGYLSGFTKFDDNRYSTKIYFEVRKQNFLEALDKNDRAKALDIFMKDLKVFAPGNEELFKEMTQLLTINDIREHESLSLYGDTESARKLVMVDLKNLIEANPLFHDKLEFPSVNSQRLRRLINQSLNWQHIQCTYPQPNPEVRTLFVDHICPPLEERSFSMSSDNNPPPSQSTSMAVSTSSTSSKSTPSSETHSAISDGAFCLGGPTSLGHPTTYGLEDNAIVSQYRLFHISDQESTVTHPDQSFFGPNTTLKNDVLESCVLKSNLDLPKMVARILNEESSPISMDFHPIQQTVLLVGTNVGDIGLWEVSSGEKLLSRNFKVWDIGACSMIFKAVLLKDPCVSVNRIAWSPEGSLFGVAYSKHIVQIYSYHGGNNIQQQVEIDAHVGGVNDLAFSAPDKQLLVLTCGDDKTVKAWHVTSGVKMYTFEGHDAPVYSLYPHSKEQIHFIFSTSMDGKIKAWLYDNLGARVDYDAPGLGWTSMAYSADDRRLFSCGTSKSGESFLVEWEESEGSIKRTYQGLQKNSLAAVRFDIMKNQFLAVGDEHVIKIWDMDKVELLTTIDAGGGLPANPYIRFNKDGMLLAVIANESRIKILATDYGLQLCASENASVDASRVLTDSYRTLAPKPISTVSYAEVTDKVVPKNGDPQSTEVVESKLAGQGNILKCETLFEINRPSQCQTLWLPSHVNANKISNLIYNNAGDGILALASNAFHLFWKWPVNDLNLGGKATTVVAPQLWRPRSCLGLMTNDLTDANSEEVIPCFALSKNDSYLMSASGGKISLFNMMTFKAMLSIMPPPPAATCIAFHPLDNNIVAIGRDNSTILIYNVRLAKVIGKLKGHSKRVSGLAFSNSLNVLVSSGADGQLIVWNADGWEKQRSRFLQILDRNEPAAMSDTHIQFHRDQTHFLAVHKAYLAIYEAKMLQCVKQWIPGEFTPITQATFSCDSQMVYASFVDGTISIFDTSQLELRCRIISTTYLPPSSSSNVHPLVIAAHPQKPNQFAVGLTDGEVVVFEPPNPAGNWTVLPPDDKVSAGKMPVKCDFNY